MGMGHVPKILGKNPDFFTPQVRCDLSSTLEKNLVTLSGNYLIIDIF